jgi:hypothetical protein
MIPTEDLEGIRDFLMGAIDDMPSSEQLTSSELDIANKLICLQLAVDCEMARRGYDPQENDPCTV